jgi:hypothetical protein
VSARIRAHLPGGNPGEYKIPGFSERLLQALGVSQYDLREAVARARSDGRCVYLAAGTHRFFACRRDQRFADRADRRRADGSPGFIERHPIVTSLPSETTLLGMLDAEDAAMFPA